MATSVTTKNFLWAEATMLLKLCADEKPDVGFADEVCDRRGDRGHAGVRFERPNEFEEIAARRAKGLEGERAVLGGKPDDREPHRIWNDTEKFLEERRRTAGDVPRGGFGQTVCLPDRLGVLHHAGPHLALAFDLKGTARLALVKHQAHDRREEKHEKNDQERCNPPAHGRARAGAEDLGKILSFFLRKKV